MKDESFDSLCSNGSRVVQLQVAPRGLRTAKVVKVERAKIIAYLSFRTDVRNLVISKRDKENQLLSHYVTAPLQRGAS